MRMSQVNADLQRFRISCSLHWEPENLPCRVPGRWLQLQRRNRGPRFPKLCECPTAYRLLAGTPFVPKPVYLGPFHAHIFGLCHCWFLWIRRMYHYLYLLEIKAECGAAACSNS